MPELPLWKKALLIVGVVVITVLFTLATVLGKDLLSKAALKKLQDKDADKRKREVDLINDAAGAKVDAVNAHSEVDRLKAEAEHNLLVDKIHQKAKDETPSDPDALAADLLGNIRR